MKHLLSLVWILLLSAYAGTTFSQVDTEFWFVVPELSHRGNTGGTPGTLRLSTLELEATVTISMPANPYDAATNPNGFQDIVLTLPPNSASAVDLSHLIDSQADPTNNQLENKALTPDGINPFGLHITATNLITAHWEVNYIYGADVWTLKGSNGLGTLFYAPFQTEYPNHLTVMPSHSAIDVVATQDNTILTFSLPDGVGASFGEPLNTTQSPASPGRVFSIGPLNRGETFSLFPYMRSVQVDAKLAGTRIASSNPIAVVIKDDNLNTASQGRSTIGDQIVPVDIAGDSYVIPAMGNPNLTFVVATQDNTNIYVHTPGNPPALYVTLMAGEQARIQSPNNTVLVISSKNGLSAPQGPPIYAYHLALNNMTRASALLPPIGCTGNTQLAFTRAREAIREEFYLFLITEDENIDNFLIDGAPADPTIISNDASKWEQLGNGWSVFRSANIPASKLAIGQHLAENSGGIFHLGIINGYSSANLGDLFYGFHSDYGGLNVGATVAGTNSSVVRACYGEPVPLNAYGGTNYQWTPNDYLNDPKSNVPTAYDLPPGPHNYTVEVSGACGSGNIPLTIVVADSIVANFQASHISGCSPLEVRIDDRSYGASYWAYDPGDGTPLIGYELAEQAIFPASTYPEPPDPFTFTHTYVNTTDQPIDYEISLLAKNSFGCHDTISRMITVLPEMEAAFTADPLDGCSPHKVFIYNQSTGADFYTWDFGDGNTSNSSDSLISYTYVNRTPFPVTYTLSLRVENEEGCTHQFRRAVTIYPETQSDFIAHVTEACSPAEITFQNNSLGAATYFWDFGDGATSTEVNPAHPYNRNLSEKDSVFTVILVASSMAGCRDTSRLDVVLHPYINAAFTVDEELGCHPFSLSIANESIGAAQYRWNFGDGSPVSNDSAPSVYHVYENTTRSSVVFSLELSVFNEEGCGDTLIREITVHPQMTANFSADTQNGCSPLEVNFNDLSVNAINYLWDFGDGEISEQASPTHTFFNSGNRDSSYQVTMTTSTADSVCVRSVSWPITVSPHIEASFDMDSSICHLTDISIRNNSIGADFFAWDFGDGSPISTSPGPVLDHYYINLGSFPVSYTVDLKVENEHGCMDQIQKDVIVFPESDGGILKGISSEISFGNTTGPISLSGHTGEVLKWQKIVKAGPWEDIDQRDTIFSEIPASADLWQYRAVIQSGACPEASSELFSIFVSPRELFISPAPDQTKREGDPDPEFTFSNSEWNDNSNFTGALGREPGEAPGKYAYLLGNLSAGSNYKLAMDPEATTFTITAALGMDGYSINQGLTLLSFSNPIQESATFMYNLPFDGRVSLSIRNMAGQVVKTLVHNKLETKGAYTIDTGEFNLEAGIYFATLTLVSDQKAAAKTLKLIKSR